MDVSLILVLHVGASAKGTWGGKITQASHSAWLSLCVEVQHGTAAVCQHQLSAVCSVICVREQGALSPSALWVRCHILEDAPVCLQELVGAFWGFNSIQVLMGLFAGLGT